MSCKLCYCNHALEFDEEVWPGSFCCNCGRELLSNKDKGIYTCFAENCTYGPMCGEYYSVCIDCYQEEKDECKQIAEQDNKIKFISHKFLCSISSIS